MTISQAIYLEYHFTNPVDTRVANRMLHYMTTAFGNASSIDHIYGDEAEQAIKKATKQIAQLVNANPREILFTSGATESINLAIQGHILYLNQQEYPAPRIAVSLVEHKAVLDTCEALAKKGLAEIIYLKIDREGRLDLTDVEQVCRSGISLLCVMAANNEIGNIYPILEIGKIAESYKIPFLCDASQAVGKIPINFADSGITYLAISAHKLYGPKGSGALVVRKGTNLEPIVFGGGHQKGIRSGTLNVPGIVGLGAACELQELEMAEDEQRIGHLRDRLQSLLVEKIPGLVINGDRTSRLFGNLHISIPGIPHHAIIARVRDQIAISTGAACSSGVETPSHVLTALGLPSEQIESSLRIGLGKLTTESDIIKAAEIIIKAVAQVSQLVSR